jgi:hypothetical protein
MMEIELGTVRCETCGRETTATVTKRCPGCWEVEHRLADYLRAPRAVAFVLKALTSAVGSALSAVADAMRTKSSPEHPQHCPFCGGTNVVLNMVEWDARSTDRCDLENTAKLTEHQCRDCDGRSFWT